MKPIHQILTSLINRTVYIKLYDRIIGWDVCKNATLEYSTRDLREIKIRLDSAENIDKPSHVFGNNFQFFAFDTEGKEWELSTSIDFITA